MRWFTLSIFLPFLIVANAYALPVTIDFDYSDGDVPEFFTVPSEYRGIAVADWGATFPWVQSFYDSGITFVNVGFEDSSHSADGSALTDVGAAQHGHYSLFWDEPIHAALLNFVNADNGGNLVFSMGAGDFYFRNGFGEEETPDQMSIFVYSNEAFSYLGVRGYGSAMLDSITYDGAPLPEPATIIFLSLGLCAVTGSIRRKTRSNQS